MDRVVAPYLETELLDLLEQEQVALRNADIETVLALVNKKLEAAKNLSQPIGIVRLRRLVAENHDLLTHLLECLRSAIIAAATPDGTLYGPADEAASEPHLAGDSIPAGP